MNRDNFFKKQKKKQAKKKRKTIWEPVGAKMQGCPASYSSENLKMNS
ncbi:hypothetical protein NC99_35750 [Sunxiuqinia dokdonensis]|uniref:Uncharacterized protein n=1 Tax=Sunxiuqinia dokdonensis TaxID=1409788 RepID=A0A0L8V5B8_9BACT|nr:hypothetical protein NC99_35750 [Sunxiuqinia dokdonensis]